MKTGFYNVEFAMPGNFGSGTMLINEPELLCDPLAEFERSQQEDGKLFLDSCTEATNAESLMSQFGVHHAVVCVTPASMGQGLEVQVSCDDESAARRRLAIPIVSELAPISRFSESFFCIFLRGFSSIARSGVVRRSGTRDPDASHWRLPSYVIHPQLACAGSTTLNRASAMWLSH
jgi:hypothetical protein